jgi:hypothetical protein
LVDVILVSGLFTCLRCGRFKALNADGTIECEALGTTKPKTICPFFKPREHFPRILWG